MMNDAGAAVGTTAMEELKPLQELFDADFRSAARGFTVEVLYGIAQRYELGPAVPENVRHQFEIARHAYIYSALYTPLCAAAELYAALAVEHALRLRHRALKGVGPTNNEPGLKHLLRLAIAEGWIADEGFDFEHLELVLTEEGIEQREVPLERRQRPTDIVLEVLPDLRNSLAHGQPTMRMEFVSTALQRAAEIINQLFPSARPA
ncbi:MAG TPA: hypothetical protein VFB08_02220 [Burkholderiales bacterium]|nr:hypothetical protein [Burkholderiales bacterium]